MNKNYFKFSVSYRDKVVSERIFDADYYNTQVNIKDLVPEIRKVLQKVLSIPNQRLSSEFYVGMDNENKSVLIDLLPKRHPVKEIYVSNNSYLKDRNINKVNIERTLKNINDKFMIVISLRDGSNELFYKKNILVDDNSIKDIQAKSNIPFENIKQIEFVEELLFDFSLHLNDNYIIQRKFTVFNFNPNSIFSEDFIRVVNEICHAIKIHIKKADIDVQYLDYEIMCKHEMGYNELKTLSQEEKKKLLRMDYSYN